MAIAPAYTGHQVVSPEDVLCEFLNHIPSQRSVVLVAHSNAGLYVPVLVRDRLVVAILRPAEVVRRGMGAGSAAPRNQGGPHGHDLSLIHISEPTRPY